ncbi:MAG: triacylglycerol lipase [Clostridium sp.]
MKNYLSRGKNLLVIILLMNMVFIFNSEKIKNIFLIIATVLLGILYLYINIIPRKEKQLNKRLKIMIGGYELVIDAILCIFLESILYIYMFLIKGISLSTWIIILNIVIALVIGILPLINGFFRLLFTSRQLGFSYRVLLLCLWWMPIVNLILLKKACKKVRFEYFSELSKEELNLARKEKEVCKTKYPIVMVHGIFFRDWMFINYWGRIPKALITNGAEIFYGKQQSSNAVCKSGEELKENILKIIKDTGCEKVNIIAHSKGGLDSRYAISCLGLDKYVASLTTINTPHRGCKFAEYLLDKLPNKLVDFIAEKYNKTFIKLGDKNPDFLSGVKDLTASRCDEFNKKVLDVEGVYYQSVMSKMKNVFSASFPLNLGYILCKIFDGENDGLVEVNSGKWGNFLGLITAKKRGISHGDVIDLTRIDIEDFNVCEFYVNLVSKLKDMGF